MAYVSEHLPGIEGMAIAVSAVQGLLSECKKVCRTQKTCTFDLNEFINRRFPSFSMHYEALYEKVHPRIAEMGFPDWEEDEKGLFVLHWDGEPHANGTHLAAIKKLKDPPPEPPPKPKPVPKPEPPMPEPEIPMPEASKPKVGRPVYPVPVSHKFGSQRLVSHKSGSQTLKHRPKVNKEGDVSIPNEDMSESSLTDDENDVGKPIQDLPDNSVELLNVTNRRELTRGKRMLIVALVLALDAALIYSFFSDQLHLETTPVGPSGDVDNPSQSTTNGTDESNSTTDLPSNYLSTGAVTDEPINFNEESKSSSQSTQEPERYSSTQRAEVLVKSIKSVSDTTREIIDSYEKAVANGRSNETFKEFMVTNKKEVEWANLTNSIQAAYQEFWKSNNFTENWNSLNESMKEDFTKDWCNSNTSTKEAFINFTKNFDEKLWVRLAANLTSLQYARLIDYIFCGNVFEREESSTENSADAVSLEIMKILSSYEEEDANGTLNETLNEFMVTNRKQVEWANISNSIQDAYQRFSKSNNVTEDWNSLNTSTKDGFINFTNSVNMTYLWAEFNRSQQEKLINFTFLADTTEMETTSSSTPEATTTGTSATEESTPKATPTEESTPKATTTEESTQKTTTTEKSTQKATTTKKSTRKATTTEATVTEESTTKTTITSSSDISDTFLYRWMTKQKIDESLSGPLLKITESNNPEEWKNLKSSTQLKLREISNMQDDLTLEQQYAFFMNFWENSQSNGGDLLTPETVKPIRIQGSERDVCDRQNLIGGTIDASTATSFDSKVYSLRSKRFLHFKTTPKNVFRDVAALDKHNCTICTGGHEKLVDDTEQVILSTLNGIVTDNKQIAYRSFLGASKDDTINLVQHTKVHSILKLTLSDSCRKTKYDDIFNKKLLGDLKTLRSRNDSITFLSIYGSHVITELHAGATLLKYVDQNEDLDIFAIGGRTNINDTTDCEDVLLTRLHEFQEATHSPTSCFNFMRSGSNKTLAHFVYTPIWKLLRDFGLHEYSYELGRLEDIFYDEK